MPNYSRQNMSNAVKLEVNTNELFGDDEQRNPQIYNLEHQESQLIHANEGNKNDFIVI